MSSRVATQASPAYQYYEGGHSEPYVPPHYAPAPQGAAHANFCAHDCPAPGRPAPAAPRNRMGSWFGAPVPRKNVVGAVCVGVAIGLTLGILLVSAWHLAVAALAVGTLAAVILGAVVLTRMLKERRRCTVV